MHTVEDRVGNALYGIKLLLLMAERDRLVNDDTYQKSIKLIDDAFAGLRELSTIDERGETGRSA
jgi:hypothetical protein